GQDRARRRCGPQRRSRVRGLRGRGEEVQRAGENRVRGRDHGVRSLEMSNWPLSPPQQRLVAQLAHLIAAAPDGDWRFMHGPVVAASQRDYPDKWEASRAGVARVIGRTLWHAHLDMPATLEDLRGPKWADRKHLRRTYLELV